MQAGPGVEWTDKLIYNYNLGNVLIILHTGGQIAGRDCEGVRVCRHAGSHTTIVGFPIGPLQRATLLSIERKKRTLEAQIEVGCLQPLLWPLYSTCTTVYYRRRRRTFAQ